MKCDHCHGFGRIALQTEPPAYRLDPCPQCHGSGIVACCEGLCEQPSEDTASGPSGTISIVASGLEALPNGPRGAT